MDFRGALMQRGKTDLAGTVGLPKAGEESIPTIMNYKGVFCFFPSHDCV